MVASIKHIFIFSGGHSAHHFLYRSFFLTSKLKKYEEMISFKWAHCNPDRKPDRDTVELNGSFLKPSRPTGSTLLLTSVCILRQEQRQTYDMCESVL